jgi:hypothetical protein
MIALVLVLASVPVATQSQARRLRALPKFRKLIKPLGSMLPASTRIPSHLYSTYKLDLTASAQSGLTLQEKGCAENLQHTIKLHIGFSSTFFDDAACKALIADVAGDKLASSFSAETNGWSKADICKGAIIYSKGGFYVDPDLNFRANLKEVVRLNTTFIAARSVGDKGQFFQVKSLLASSPPPLLPSFPSFASFASSFASFVYSPTCLPVVLQHHSLLCLFHSLL